MKNNQEQAQDILKSIFGLDLRACEVTVCVASEKDDSPLAYRWIDLSPSLANRFRDVASANIERHKQAWSSGELRLLPFALETNLRGREIEYLAIDDYPTMQHKVAPLSSLPDMKTFDDKEEPFVAHMRFYVIRCEAPHGEPVYFYRSYTPKKMLGRSPFFAMLRGQYEYDRVEDSALLFDKHIDSFSRGDTMFILEKDNFYYIFRFLRELIKTAEQTFEVIRKHVPIQNFEQFAQDCKESETRFAKLRNIATRPYLDRLNIDKLKEVIKRFKLPVQVVEVAGQEMLVYNAKDKWGLLKLLDDDYLWSMLTEHSYEAAEKRDL